MKNKKIIPITNAVMFAMVMQDKELCRQVLETLLQIEIDHLEDVKTEEVLKPALETKGVRLDVFVKNSTAVFDVELQMTNTGNLPLRARYYQAVCDYDVLKTGAPYQELKQSYVIFLCPFDLTGDGEVCYVVESAVNGMVSEKYNDKCKKLFFNFTKFASCDNIHTSALLKFFASGQPSDDLTKRLSEKVVENNGHEKWRRENMTLEMYVEDRMFEAEQIGIEKGFERGSFQTKYETARNLLYKGMDFEFVHDVTGLSIEAVQKIADELNADK
ncbi:MAG: Rpn family recombination-promoting nuclease/putative transposase [Treponemataceae bacterium]|nr:Rpn family recombination-promoting nuclease/putative transposase [Treponemataceae bacterium]